jgi:hypothetical protein
LIHEEEQIRQKFSGYVRKPFTRREMFDALAQFLPRKDETSDPARSVNTARAGTRQLAATTWSEMAAELRKLEVQEWPGVRDSMAMSEVGAFARKLESLARAANCELLLTYAEALAHFAETYAVDTLEKRLQEFPAVIERIERPDYASRPNAS